MPVLRLDADDLCLSFVNTRYWRGTATPTDELGVVTDLLVWLARAAPSAASLADGWAAAWAADPGRAARAHATALDLREMLQATLALVAAGQGASVAALNAALARAPARAALACDGVAGWAVGEPGSVEALLAPVLWSAADLLAGPRRARLRVCANPQCGWLFLDDSKSGTRRWCAMSACGNRAKARRHYQRARAAKPS
jgi:predicted RNA-binding Zn ribbon-like protein